MGLTYNDLHTRPWTRGDATGITSLTPGQIGNVLYSQEAGTSAVLFTDAFVEGAAQGFRIHKPTTISGFGVKVDRNNVAGATGNFDAAVQTGTIGTGPSGTEVSGLGISDFNSVAKTAVPQSGEDWAYFGVATAVELSPGDYFLCVFDDDAKFSEDAGIEVNTSDTFSPGQRYTTTSPTGAAGTWTGLAGDLNFRLYQQGEFRVMGVDYTDGSAGTVTIYDAVGPVGTGIPISNTAAITESPRWEPNGLRFTNGIHVETDDSTALEQVHVFHIEG